MLTHVAYSVLDHDTGKKLNYGQLIKHPKFQEIWNKFFSNETGRLCQGVGTGKLDDVKEWKAPILSMSSSLKAYQSIVLTKYTTLQ